MVTITIIAMINPVSLWSDGMKPHATSRRRKYCNMNDLYCKIADGIGWWRLDLDFRRRVILVVSITVNRQLKRNE